MLLNDLFENAAVDSGASEARKDAMLRDMLSRANQAEVREWLLDNGTTEEDLADPEIFLHEFAYWLEQERSISFDSEHGCLTFWRIDLDDAARLIGDNPVLLYHFTSSSRVASIRKHGLDGSRRSVNRRSTEGAYLTTETSGPAVGGYVRNALRGTKNAYGVRIEVVTRLSDLQPDPDDADISSGAVQFVADHIAPSQIVGIERC